MPVTYRRNFTFALLAVSLGTSAYAAVLTYGDKDCLNQGCYGASDPTTGATLQGLSLYTVTLASAVSAMAAHCRRLPISPVPTRST